MAVFMITNKQDQTNNLSKARASAEKFSGVREAMEKTKSEK